MRPWLPYNRKPTGKPRMFCFPPGGAGAVVFRPWIKMMESDLEVCPIEFPGRLARIQEPPASSIKSLAREIADAMEEDEIDGRVYIFGYSMGSIVAFETARELRRRLGEEPVQMFASAHRAPNVVKMGKISDASDEAVQAWFQETYGYFPPQVMADPSLLKMITKILRHDARFLEEYVYEPEVLLQCPLHVFAGKDDASTSEEELMAWKSETLAEFSLQYFPGGHFFWEQCMEELAEVVLSHVRGNKPKA